MFKQILIGLIATILIGALLIGIYDLSVGASSLQIPTFTARSTNQPASGQGVHTPQSQGGRQQAGQTSNEPTGGLSLTPSDWFSMTGQVTNITNNSLTIQTAERGEVNLQLGRPGFAAQQGITFNLGDAVTVLAFDSPEGLLQAGQITNNNTQQTLYLRDPNGRPLWAGQGGGGQGQGQGKGQGRGQGNGQGQGNN